MIKVSIILPIYNVDQYLEETFDSLIHQTLHEIEIIAVNDGSTDQSEAIIKKYMQKELEDITLTKVVRVIQVQKKRDVIIINLILLIISFLLQDFLEER